MEKMTLSQKKTIIQVIVFVLMLFAAWFFLYLPPNNSMKTVKSELLETEKQIEEIERMIDKTTPINESLDLLRERHARLKGKFPEKEEESLRVLSDFARKFNIDVISTKPQAKKIVYRKDKEEPVKIKGKILQQVYVSIEMKCYYQDLVSYIEMLKNDLPAFMMVESVKIIKDKTKEKNSGSAAKFKLNVILNLSLYLLS